VDKNVNRIIDQLKQQDVFEDTLIIYTSDHGKFIYEFIAKIYPHKKKLTQKVLL
jgi:arylsulfatase A-like enzyme